MAILTCPDFSTWSPRLAANMAEDDSGCWVWTGYVDSQGYGRFVYGPKAARRQTGAHRASWLVHRGDIPDGLVLDHLCRNRACVNPWHLDVVTTKVNTAR